jgi:hypothetical protein
LGLIAQYEERNYPLLIMFVLIVPLAILLGILLWRHGSKLLMIPLPQDPKPCPNESFVVPEIIDNGNEN